MNNATVTWSTTAVSGLNLVKNGNVVTINASDDMPEGTYNLVALYGEYSKLLKITIQNKEHEHSYVEKIITEAKCLTDGEAEYTCSCGNSYTQPITALGHDYIDGVCSRCGDTINLEAGLYDINNNLISSWDELTGTYGLALGNTTVTSNKQLSVIINNNSKLKNATKLVIPDTVTTIPKLSFYNCTTLKSIIIPNSVLSIGENAFALSGITSINIPNSVKTISQKAFYRCPNIETVDMGNGVEQISIYSFKECPNLLNVKFSNKITTIPEQCFTSCSNLENIVLSEKLETIKYEAFMGCNIKNLILPNTLKTIDYKAFQSNKNLVSATLHEGLLSIGWNAFSQSGLTSIIIPDSVTTLDYGAFSDCKNLTFIKLGKGITEIKHSTFMNTGITSIGLPDSGADLEIPNTITKISNDSTYFANGAFSNCSNLKTVTLPENITAISKGLFASCPNLESVNISSNTKSIAATAFYDCSKLNMTIPNTVTSIYSNSFYN